MSRRLAIRPKLCPYCRAPARKLVRNGTFWRLHGRAEFVQRFRCSCCRKTCSSQTPGVIAKPALSRLPRESTGHLNQRLLRLLCAGTSQRETARLMAISKNTVARKIPKLAEFARRKNHQMRTSISESGPVTFDEMETFEHTKCKPLSIAVAVTKDRRLLSVRVAQMPAKGPLAEISRRKYGPRKDLRPDALRAMAADVKESSYLITAIRSDESPRYPSFVRREFSDLEHLRYKGRRGCIVGQGELKRGGFDPLFCLNHTCAMIRDHIKRLSRRTWCTTKDPGRLQDLLDIYIFHHNARIDCRDAQVRLA